MRFFSSPRFIITRWCSTSAPKGAKSRSGWESVVGLEVHAQILSNSKLFSPSGIQFGAPVNTLVSLFDAATPGTLPALNRRCVEAAVTTALALQCKINLFSTFDRKHYFYADLPAGYQITQQRKPIAENGELRFPVFYPNGEVKPHYKTCRIRQVQLEQDSGKSLHDNELDRSLIDLNRAGIALMEIVFQPDLTNGEEAACLVKELCLILQNLGTCSCKMEEGALRVDANVSVNKPGEPLGVRTEVKNLSSVRSMVGAIEFEIDRQIELLNSGKPVINETRSYDGDRKTTLPMRDKEVQQDYRFMPEPNLPPLKLIDKSESNSSVISDQVNIAKLRAGMAELPDSVRQNLITTYNLRLEMAQIIVSTPGFLSYYLSVMGVLPARFGPRAAIILQKEVMSQLKDNVLNFDTITVKPEFIAEIVELVESGKVHVNTSKDILVLLFDGDKRSPNQIIHDEGWMQVTDDNVILELCQKVMNENPKLVENYRAKRTAKFINKLMGLIKKSTNEKVCMKKVNETVLKLMDETDKKES